MTSGFLPLSSDLYPQCKAYLASREYCCVALTAAFLEAGQPDKSGWQRSSFIVLVAAQGTATPDIAGILHVTPGGTLLHLLDSPARVEPFRSQIAQWLANRTLHCILGTATETRFLESVIPRPLERTVDYELMTLCAEPAEEMEKLPMLPESVFRKREHLHIRRIHPGDAELLLPLQLGYEEEEVLAPGKTPDKNQCLLTFRAALSRQEVYAVFHGKTPVCKAGTNARGLYWDQLGGIYTAPGFRSKGIASALVAHVVRRRIRQGRKTVLFVKTGNLSAKSVYGKVGFIRQNDFRIVYF